MNGDYETRADGQLVRKDRWEVTVRRIVALLWGNRQEFECDEVVEAVRALIKNPKADDEALVQAVMQEVESFPKCSKKTGAKEGTYLPHCPECGTGPCRVPKPVKAKPTDEQLKHYGYAPGYYMNRCLYCKQVAIDLNKRSYVCRPCAERRFAINNA